MANEIVKRGGRWISPSPGSYDGEYTRQMLRSVVKATPAEIAAMQGVDEEIVRRHAWRDYQALQDEGIACYPCYNVREMGAPILYYKTNRGDKLDKQFLPIYLDRLRNAKDRTYRRHKIFTALVTE